MDPHSLQDIEWMRYAIDLAKLAEIKKEVPVGAVLIKDDHILGEGYNCPIATHDPTAHAEIQAIRMAAKKMNNYRIPNSTLYITLEPCAMCLGAIIQARITRIVFGAFDPKAGALGSVCNLLEHKLNHTPQVCHGILSEECGLLLRSFFKKRRKEKNEIFTLD